MVFGLIVLLSALSISAVAAWFSITGLVAIFPLFPISIYTMGIVLEVGKLVTASWLYRNWESIPILLKSYLTIAVVVLMFITSMGIFGYLSKMHIEQNAPIYNNELKIERIIKKIESEERIIHDAEKVIKQLDDSIQTLIEYDRIRGPTGAIASRNAQKQEREELNSIIKNSQETIDSLTDEKLELETEIKQAEVEVGPIKYISKLIYDDNTKADMESTVRAVILTLVFVFDPLAVLLVVAANMSMVNTKKLKIKSSNDKDIIHFEKTISKELDEISNLIDDIAEKKEGDQLYSTYEEWIKDAFPDLHEEEKIQEIIGDPRKLADFLAKKDADKIKTDTDQENMHSRTDINTKEKEKSSFVNVKDVLPNEDE